jgi:NAD(P)-dependent dehydrogenase (short-subunit alcohol dehydrogenase family)
MTMNRFEGKVALITGGNSGIGLAAARAFAAEGARVVITGRDDATLAAAGADLAIRADVTRLEDLDRVVAQTRERFGRLDIVFANAGIARFGPIDAVSEDVYDSVMSTNVKGVYFTVQKTVALFDRGGAVILNSSIAASKGMAGGSVYSASKAAVRSFGRTLAAELLGRGIRVNVVGPGPIETPIYSLTPGLKERFVTNVPMKRAGTAAEVARTVLFLASEDASYITGADFAVDGGATM